MITPQKLFNTTVHTFGMGHYLCTVCKDNEKKDNIKLKEKKGAVDTIQPV